MGHGLDSLVTECAWQDAGARDNPGAQDRATVMAVGKLRGISAKTARGPD